MRWKCIHNQNHASFKFNNEQQEVHSAGKIITRLKTLAMSVHLITHTCIQMI